MSVEFSHSRWPDLFKKCLLRPCKDGGVGEVGSREREGAMGCGNVIGVVVGSSVGEVSWECGWGCGW